MTDKQKAVYDKVSPDNPLWHNRIADHWFLADGTKVHATVARNVAKLLTRQINYGLDKYC